MNIIKNIKNNRSFAILFLLFVVFFLFTIIYMVFTGNGNEQYSDIVIGQTAMLGANKSAEVLLLWILSFGGIGGYLLYYFFFKFQKEDDKICGSSQINLPLIIIILTSVIYLYETCIQMHRSSVLSAVYVVSLFSFLKDKNNIINNLIYFFFNLYFLYAVERLLIFGGLNISVSLKVVSFIALGFTILSLFLIKNSKFIFKLIFIEQLFLPALLLIYLADGYLYNNQIMHLNILPQVKFLIIFLIVVLLVNSLYKLIRCWNKDCSFDNIISLGTCISIISFNLFNYVGNVVPVEFHHPYENIIAYHQIFQMGQIPFKDFIPVSGLYSLVHGAMFQLFGNGELTQYYSAENVFYLLISILLIVLMNLHINKTVLFLISVTYYFLHPAVYSDRFIFILPIMLVLSLPQLISNKNLWLKIWLLTSLFHGLYYPVLGAALCLSYLPLALYLFITFIQSQEIKIQIKNFRFWFEWFVCMLPVILTVPLLIGTYHHISIMGSQTILADGLPRFGQDFGNFLLPYFSEPIKSVVIYAFTFIIPSAFVLVPCVLALNIRDVNMQIKTKLGDNFQNALIVISPAIFALVSYSYTMLRLDVGDIYSRSKGVFVACCTILVIYAYKYFALKARVSIISFVFFVLAIPSLWGFLNNEAKLQNYISIPEYYWLSKGEKGYKIGTGFIDIYTYLYIDDTAHKIDKQNNYFALSFFGDYYIFDIKGFSVLEIGTVKGYDAYKETIGILLKNNVVVADNIDPMSNYYFYHWLMTSGKYYWDFKTKEFYPNNNKYDEQKIREINGDKGTYYDGFSAGIVPSSLGLSFNTLKPIFSVPKISYTSKTDDYVLNIIFDKEIDGNEADFLYLEFSETVPDISFLKFGVSKIQPLEPNFDFEKLFMKKSYNPKMNVRFIWQGNDKLSHSMFSQYGQGILLIPLGVGNKWLLNKHKDLNISVMKNNVQIPFPKINKIEFLKLRE